MSSWDTELWEAITFSVKCLRVFGDVSNKPERKKIYLIIFIYIPLMANNTQPCVHQLRAEFVHEKRTKEKFIASSFVALPFAHAFSASTVCAPLPNSPQATLLQAVLTSTAGEVLTILDYALNGPISILHDPNVHIKHTTTLPNQRTSFIFSVALPRVVVPQDITLDVTFTLPSPIPATDDIRLLPPIKHTFSTVVSLALPSPQFVIETRNPPTAYLAQPVQFELLVSSHV